MKYNNYKTGYKNYKKRINSKHFPKQNSKRVINDSYYKCKYRNPRPQVLHSNNRWRNPTPEEIKVKETLTVGHYGSFTNSWNDFISKMFDKYRNKKLSYYFWMNKFYNYKSIQYRAFLNSKVMDYDEMEINNYLGAIMATLFKIKDKNSSGKDKNSIPNYLSIEELDLRVQSMIFGFVKRYWYRFVHRKVLI